MPVTILSSDLAYARLDGELLALHYDSALLPKGYVVIHRGEDGAVRKRLGPFVHEDEAIEAARDRYGPLEWSLH